MHRQNKARLHHAKRLHYARLIHSIGAVHGHHYHVELTDPGEIFRVQDVVQVTEMADAQSRYLEDEDRIAVRHADPLVAADIGWYVADHDVADLEVVLGR